MFTDTVTVYQKQEDSTYTVTVVHDVQWSDKISKFIQDGKLQTVKTTTITFEEPFKIDLLNHGDEDAIFFGEVIEEITSEKGHRLSDLLKKHPKSGIIKEVNDNSNRTYLKNIKVMIY